MDTLKTLVRSVGLTVLCLGLSLASAQAGQRIPVRDVDRTNTPMASTAASVSLTPAVAATQSVTSSSAILSNQTKAAATQAALTLLTKSMLDSNGVVTLVVTGVTVNTVFGFASTTAGVSTNAVVGTAVTGANGTNSGGYGFTAAQAGAILTNSALFHDLLQTPHP